MQCARKRRSALPVGDALNRQFAGDTGEAGYLLIAVVFFVALVTLSLAVAAPRIAASIQRDRELEAVQRGLQYKRAIRLYYKKYNAYPTSVDQLVKSNDIRFLRRRYLDPMTGKDDWKVLHQGETHVCPLGFFGQPLSVGSSSSIAGATPVGASTSSGSGLGAGMSSGFGGSSTGFGGSSSGFGSSGGSSGFGSSNTSGTGGTGSSGSSTATCGTTSVAGSTGAGAGTGAGMGSGTGSGMGLAGAGASAGADSGTGGSGFGGSGFSNSGFGGGSGTGTSTGTGPTGLSGGGSSSGTTALGFTGGSGGPIVGVTLPSDKGSTVAFRLQDHYNRWEFVYDPVEEQAQAAAGLIGGAGGTGVNGSSIAGSGSATGLAGGTAGAGGTGFGGTSSTGSGSGFGNTSGSGFGGSSGSGSSGSGFGGGFGSGSGGTSGTGSSNPFPGGFGSPN